MQPLKDQLASTISHLHSVFETHVFIAICRGFWDRMGQVSSLSSGICYLAFEHLRFETNINCIISRYISDLTGNFKFLGEQKRE